MWQRSLIRPWAARSGASLDETSPKRDARTRYPRSFEAAPLAELSDEGVQALANDDVARRILHVTYGSILGDSVLRAKLLDVLTADGGAAYEHAVADRVSAHLTALSG